MDLSEISSLAHNATPVKPGSTAVNSQVHDAQLADSTDARARAWPWASSRPHLRADDLPTNVLDRGADAVRADDDEIVTEGLLAGTLRWYDSLFGACG